MPAFAQHRVPHPLQSHRKGWVIERTGVPDERFCSWGWRSETAVAYLHAAETSDVEVEY
jgi:hypothetical protein